MPSLAGSRGLLACSLLLQALILPAEAGTPTSAITPQQGRQAVERGLDFLVVDAQKWKKEHACSTCHHGTMTVWTLSEAKGKGYPVSGETFTEMVTWAKEKLKDLDRPRDTRPGWNMVNSPALYLAVMARIVPKQDAISGDDLKRIAGHLARHQEADGSWAWSLAPAKNRPPPFFESDEVATLLAHLALGGQRPADAQEASASRTCRDNAAAWLRKTEASESTQAMALRMLRLVYEAAPRKDVGAAIDQLLRRQNKDGGWGQDKNLASDAYATGQALYFLSLTKVKKDRPEIRRAVAFLVASQKEDGSWPMTSRAHPGEKPASNPVPIIHFGSAWATLGLMRSAP
jgi:hypothetical protein